jgi:hypothetical protein
MAGTSPGAAGMFVKPVPQTGSSLRQPIIEICLAHRSVVM